MRDRLGIYWGVGVNTSISDAVNNEQNRKGMVSFACLCLSNCHIILCFYRHRAERSGRSTQNNFSSSAPNNSRPTFCPSHKLASFCLFDRPFIQRQNGERSRKNEGSSGECTPTGPTLLIFLRACRLDKAPLIRTHVFPTNRSNILAPQKIEAKKGAHLFFFFF